MRQMQADPFTTASSTTLAGGSYGLNLSERSTPLILSGTTFSKSAPTTSSPGTDFSVGSILFLSLLMRNFKTQKND